MRLVRIGSAPTCDIVLNSKYVSALHAEITILDDGKMLIEDKTSSNGTYVGHTKLNPNQPVPVQYGDHVRLADVDIPWHKVPKGTDLSRFAQVINIGSSQLNQLVISSNSVSRYHAVLKIDKKGKAFICDNKSTNGTTLNGIKLNAGQDYPVKRGDIVMVAGDDISSRIEEYLPKGINKGLVGGIVGAVAVAAIAILAYIFWPPIIDPISTTAYVHTEHHYTITAKAGFGDFKFNYPDALDPVAHKYEAGTAFFLDKEGRLGTTRRLMKPWDPAYLKDETLDAFNLEVKLWLENHLFPCYSESDDERLKKTEIGRAVYNSSDSRSELNNRIRQILSAPLTVTGGEMDCIYLGYNGQTYTNLAGFDQCVFIDDSNDATKDVAIIQLNKKKTPSDVKGVFNVKNVKDNIVIEAGKTNLKTTGYPNGLVWGLDGKNKTLNNTTKKTYCTKTPTNRNFELNGATQVGTVGSPVYLEDGTLVGIISVARTDANAPSVATHAKFLKDLYTSVTSAIAK